jgi:hypothetical protein
MNLQSLRPAKDFAVQYGVKAIVFGPSGAGKTPIVNTAPRPLLLACEPGLLSMRNSNVPTFQATTTKLIDEFFEWLFNSSESKNFDTVAIDSTSQMAITYLEAANKTNKHGLAAYGEMADNVMKHLNRMYFMPQKHAYLIAKQEIVSIAGNNYRRPAYEGKYLNKEVPGLYDEILHLDIQNVPGMGQVKAFRCQPAFDVLARDRTGMLNEFEPPDFGALVRKAIQ